MFWVRINIAVYLEKKHIEIPIKNPFNDNLFYFEDAENKILPGSDKKHAGTHWYKIALILSYFRVCKVFVNCLNQD